MLQFLQWIWQQNIIFAFLVCCCYKSVQFLHFNRKLRKKRRQPFITISWSCKYVVISKGIGCLVFLFALIWVFLWSEGWGEGMFKIKKKWYDKYRCMFYTRIYTCMYILHLGFKGNISPADITLTGKTLRGQYD